MSWRFLSVRCCAVLSVVVLLLPTLTACAFPSFPSVRSARSFAVGSGLGSIRAETSGVVEQVVSVAMVPDDYDTYDDGYELAVQEANELYARLIVLLKTVDSPESFRTAQNDIRNVWRRIAQLESRYPALDPVVLSDRLFSDEQFVRLSEEFAQELERIRGGVPDVAALLNGLIEKEVNTGMAEGVVGEFDNLMTLYEEMIVALEGIETPEDAAAAYDTLRTLALRLKEAESEYGGFKDEFQLIAEGSDRMRKLSFRLDAVLARLLSDSNMERVFDALEPLADDGNTDPAAELVPTPEEQVAMRDYAVALQEVVQLFRKITTTDDLATYADELRRLREMDREFDKRLAGQRGEQLVESDPVLVQLLMEMGAEQLRISEDPALRAGLSILLEE